MLAHSGAVLPPIIVHRPTMRVVDGLHRLRATVARGEDMIRARFFDGDRRDAFLISVRENTRHGLPLSLRDRTTAANRIVRSHAQWSDRAIAEATGLSPATVGEIRRVAQAGAQQTTRLGRDGRVRPLNASHGRLRAAQLITEMPNASLRQIAQLSGISPGTVRDVRARLGRGEDPVPAALKQAGSVASFPSPSSAGTEEREPAMKRQRPAEEQQAGYGCSPEAAQAATATATGGRRRPALPQPRQSPDGTKDHAALLAVLLKDPALRYAESGRLLLRLLSTGTLPAQHWEEMINTVPGHSVGMVSQAARVCAEAWADFAASLERKA